MKAKKIFIYTYVVRDTHYAPNKKITFVKIANEKETKKRVREKMLFE